MSYLNDLVVIAIDIARGLVHRVFLRHVSHSPFAGDIKCSVTLEVVNTTRIRTTLKWRCLLDTYRTAYDADSIFSVWSV